MKNYITMLFLIIAGASIAVAQQRPIVIKGIVRSGEDNRPMAGVTVQALSNKQKQQTDHTGAFSFSLSKVPDSLHFSYIGFESVVSSVTQSTAELIIEMIVDNTAIEEIVVNTGYQSMKPNEMTGSFQVIDQKTLQNQTGTNILQRLNNEAVGIRFDNLPDNVFGDEELDFSVRGLSTINAPSAPLIVLDGFIYEGNISNIDPNSIESVTILKDAAATSIWGARAGNGVVVINSKGKTLGDQPTRISFNKLNTVKAVPDLRQIYQMDAADFIEIEKYIFDNGYYDRTISRTPYTALTPAVEILLQQREGVISTAEAESRLARLAGIDGVANFQDAFLNSPFTDQYTINVHGGSRKNSYGFGAGYLSDKNYNEARFNKINLQLTNSFRPIDQLLLNIGVHYTNSKTKSGKPNYSSLTINRTKVPYLEFVDDQGDAIPLDLNFGGDYMAQTYSDDSYLDWRYYPVDDWRHSRSSTNTEELYANMNLQYKIASYLDVNIAGQYQMQRSGNETLNDVDSYSTRMLINQYLSIDPSNGTVQYNIPKGGVLSQDTRTGSSYTVRGQSNFRNTWGRHGVVGMLGGEARQTLSKGLSGTHYGYSADPLRTVRVDYARSFTVIPTFGTSLIPGAAGTSRSTHRYVSLYTNWVYTLDRKYNLSFSMRRDGANVFGANTNDKWNPFWSLGASWNIADESFFKTDMLSTLKLRTTYGVSGNVDPRRTPLPVASNSTGRYTSFPALVISNLNDPSLQWETVATVNVGADFATKGNRISGSIDYYVKNGDQLYGATTYDYTTYGQSGMITKNTAKMRTHGFDIMLNSKNLRKKVGWDTRLLLAVNKDRTVDYYSQFGSNLTPILGDGSIITPIIGKPLYAIAAYKWAGLDEHGDPQGLLDGVPSTDYREIRNEAVNSGMDETNVSFIGSSRPQLFGSVMNTFTYKNFSLAVNISFKGDYFYKSKATNYSALFSTGTVYPDIETRWRASGDEEKTNMPVLKYPVDSNRDSFYNMSEIHVHRGDHVRLEYVNFSWHPTIKVRDKAIEAELYINTSNLGLLWSKNPNGTDPDYENRIAPLRTTSLGFRFTL